MTYFTKSSGDSLRASQVNALLKQGIPPFTDATARDAAIVSPDDGQHAYLTDSDTLTEYRSSVPGWVTLQEPVQSWTPTISQPGSISKTVNWGFYQRSGGIYIANCKMTITGSGTGGNAITVTAPITHVVAFGSFAFFDTSLSIYRVGNVLPQSTTIYSFVIDSGADLYGIAGTDGMTNGDVIWMQVTGTY